MDLGNEFLQIYLNRMVRALTDGNSPLNRTSSTKEVVISFDGNYRAFIPTTTGYNKKEDRLYLLKCKFTNELALQLHSERIHHGEIDGGRVFINKEGSFLRKPTGDIVKFSNLSVPL